uniref:(California timema) hypothetical protein n=1 Tax=Timema californicum TaxID=61474 RepID=A0A7R9IYN8_TIMCA|nr:unnamed protein product [Timema californicum]
MRPGARDPEPLVGGGATVLRGTLGKGLGPSSSVCSSSEGVCLQWESATLKVTQEGDECQKVEWTSPGVDGNVTQFEDCFDIGEDHWFGGAERQQQVWPFEKYTFDENSWITKLDQYQAMAEPYWVTSRGVYIYVDDEVPLFVDVNNHEDNGVCLVARRSDPYLPNIPALSLSYRLCTLDNAREAQLHAINNYLRKPIGIPDERMLTHPVWSTWAKYKKNIDADLVREFADNIVKHGFNNSQLEIDEQWERCFGSLEFDETKFPDVKNLTDYLKSRGFRVTLWTPPFINVGCEPYYSYALEKGYFVRNPENVTTTTWWEGEAGLVDFTNWEAKYWWEDRVWDNLREGGFDSRKFDAGESSFAPQLPVLNASKADHPNIFSTSPVCSEGNASSGIRNVDWSLATKSSAISRLEGTRCRTSAGDQAVSGQSTVRVEPKTMRGKYVETAARFGNQIEVRTARRTQSLNIFLRMLDKNSEWGFSNGLNTLVTTLLVFNIAGYPFVLPDMIGGNGYNGAPSKELFIRWTQTNTFMPAMQFAYPPWDYDSEVNITHVYDPILGAVGVCSTKIQPSSVTHRLDHPDVVPTVEMLEHRAWLHPVPCETRVRSWSQLQVRLCRGDCGGKEGGTTAPNTAILSDSDRVITSPWSLRGRPATATNTLAFISYEVVHTCVRITRTLATCVGLLPLIRFLSEEKSSRATEKKHTRQTLSLMGESPDSSDTGECCALLGDNISN